MLDDAFINKIGFKVPFGNWIAPDGTFIISDHPDHQHAYTLEHYLGEKPTVNPLRWMNEHVEQGFIRIIMRDYVMFQVSGHLEDLWSSVITYQKLRYLLKLLGDTQIHIFSSFFYIIGRASDIKEKRISLCELRILQIGEVSHGSI